MNKKQYVIDASPIICFSEAKLEFILEKLFSEILIPESVYNEILNGLFPGTVFIVRNLFLSGLSGSYA